jgi:adenylate cyclase
LAELLTPAAVLRVINSYFTEMSEPIRDSQGIIDKYIGDGIMAFWVPPFTDREEHARLACLSALAQRERLAAFQARLPELTGLRHGVPPIAIRIGIATGDVVVGNVGSEVSKNYTVIGDTVNLAARLEALNKQYGTVILIAGTTEALARGAIETRELDLVAVAGKSEPIRIFELLAAQGGLSPEASARRDRFETALAAYRSRDWPAARAGFESCTQGPQPDPPAQVFLARLEQVAADPPGEDWDGVWRPATK